MPTNFQLKRLKMKLDIVEKPENLVHKLTDSNGPLSKPEIYNTFVGTLLVLHVSI